MNSTPVKHAGWRLGGHQPKSHDPIDHNALTRAVQRFARNVRYRTPVAALRLAEDTSALELAIRLLGSLDTTNITASDSQLQRDFGCLMRDSTLTLLRTWLRYARTKMRKDYLA